MTVEKFRKISGYKTQLNSLYDERKELTKQIDNLYIHFIENEDNLNEDDILDEIGLLNEMIIDIDLKIKDLYQLMFVAWGCEFYDY